MLIFAFADAMLAKTYLMKVFSFYPALEISQISSGRDKMTLIALYGMCVLRTRHTGVEFSLIRPRLCESPQ